MASDKDSILALAGEPVAYLHWERPDADVVTASVRNVWGKVTADRISKYTIPCYTADQVLAARKPLGEEIEVRAKSLIALAAIRELTGTQKESIESTIDRVKELRQQLAAAQADNERLREALRYYANTTYDVFPSVARRAIAQPSDTSALEAMIAKAGEVMRERAIGAVTWPFDAPTIRGEIRALPGVTMEDLK